WRRRRGRTYEVRDPRRRPHDVPSVLVEIHLYQHVAGIRHTRRNHLLAAAHFHNFFHGDHHAANLVLTIESSHAALQALFDFLFKARVGMDDVPLHSHRLLYPFTHQTS